MLTIKKIYTKVKSTTIVFVVFFFYSERKTKYIAKLDFFTTKNLIQSPTSLSPPIFSLISK